MSLPKFDAPIFTAKLESGPTVQYRPFTVREEKIFLIAEQSETIDSKIAAIKQVISNCIIDPIDVNTLPAFDVEYLFLQLMSKSVNGVVTTQYRDLEDHQLNKFSIDIEAIRPVAGEGHSRIVKLSDELTIEFRYPTINDVEYPTKFDLIASCFKTIYYGDQVIDAESYTLEEKLEFLNNFTKKDFQTILDTFIDTMPKLTYTIRYKNTLGNDRKIELEGINDFF